MERKIFPLPDDVFDIPKTRRRIEDYLRKCDSATILLVAQVLNVKPAKKKEGGKK